MTATRKHILKTVHVGICIKKGECVNIYNISGAWMAQSVKGPTSAQVMISQLMGSSLTSGSVLTAQSLEPASDSVSVSLCPSPTHVYSLSLSLS